MSGQAHNQSVASLHNPLLLGTAFDSTTSLHRQSLDQHASTTPLAPVGEGGDNRRPENVVRRSMLGLSNLSAALGSETDPAASGQSTAEQVSPPAVSHSPAAPVAAAAATMGPATSAHPTTPPLQDRPDLHHTRTAPTTLPVNPVAHIPHTMDDPSDMLKSSSHGSDGDDKSSSATLNNSPSAAGAYHGVPLAAGGLNGQPLPGSKAPAMAAGDFPRDLQAGTVGAPGGAAIAEKAMMDLGINEKGEPRADGGESRDELGTLPPLDAARKIERTASGTHVTKHVIAANGTETVSGFGMTPITRQPSLPPNVGMFGGVAPSGEDAMMGLRAVRSHEEELERQLEMEKKGPDPWAVRFEPGERANPKNWGVGYRWYLTGVAGLLVLNSTFASSSPAGIVEDLIKYFEFSQEIAVLTIALFVAGYCVGPILWGPLSESYGRRPIFIITFIFYTGFQVGCALSKNTASILVFRFLGGTFASAPLTNAGALLADIWDVDHRGQAMSIFSLAPFAGPSIGPIVSGFISVAGVDWRWVFWILTMFAGFCLLVIVFTVPETYAPMLLVYKAKRMRKETGETQWYAQLEKADNRFSARVQDILVKPWAMLFQEPMLMAITLYMSFVYGVVYLLFEAYPFVFVDVYGFNAGENGLAFLGFFSGGFLAVVFFMTVIEPRYQRHVAHMAPQPPSPEKRLEMCVISAWALVIAMFWFGWSAYRPVHWISCVIAGGLIGVGVLGMFVSLFNYAIDVYLWAAASALAIMTVMRSFFGAGFPLFATQMYSKLGVHWASSLLGFLALVMAPIPLVLIKYGPALRKRSKYSPNKKA